MQMEEGNWDWGPGTWDWGGDKKARRDGVKLRP